MSMRRTRTASLLLMLAGLALSTQCLAQGKGRPRWTEQKEEKLDKQRYNESYHFKVFNTYDFDVNKLRKEKFKPLMEYIGQEFDVKTETMTLDSLQLEVGEETVTYSVKFPTPDGEGVVYAQRIDVYEVYEDYEVNAYQWEYYQLFAVSSQLNTLPDFDDFSVSRTYNSAALVMSLIPGMGQVYKGQKAKGYSILGAEAVLVAGSVGFSVKKNYCRRKVRHEIPDVDSWKSKQRSWRQMRNMCIVAAGGLYVYNLIDAAVTKGNRHLIVNKSKNTNLSFTPAAFSDGVGAAFAINF